MLALLFTLACGPSLTVTDREVPAACGMCQYKMEEVRGCFWAVEIDGEKYVAAGTELPTNEEHDAHGPEGMCMMGRTAIVSGEVRDDRFWATRFDLQPADPSRAAPVEPHSH